MKLFTCTDFEGHYPVGVSAVIIADDHKEARKLLSNALNDSSLKDLQDGTFTLREIRMDKKAIILSDGNY